MKLSVWRKRGGRIVLSLTTEITVGAQEHPEEWEELGTIEVEEKL